MRGTGWPVEVVNIQDTWDQTRDAAETIGILQNTGYKPGFVVVDNYGLEEVWERALRSACQGLLVIDDLADRVHDCDILLDPNIYPDLENRYTGKVPLGCLQLLGPEYLPLRPEFTRERDKAEPRRSVRNLFVFFGSSDPFGVTPDALRAIRELPLSRIDVVAGAANQRLPEIEAMVAEMPAAELHVQAEDIASLMARADLALGACGHASYERCALGLPAITVSSSENEEEFGRYMHELGYLVHLGRAGTVSARDLNKAVLALAGDENSLRDMSVKGMELTGARGLSKVAQAMLTMLADKRGGRIRWSV
jgi:UDP-2,4-diacetamido-2,4,6-trideoxy-beta-L-altropyranose hydrolase